MVPTDKPAAAGINTKVDAMERGDIEFWANLFTTASYYVLTIQIIVLIRDSKVTHKRLPIF